MGYELRTQKRFRTYIKASFRPVGKFTWLPTKVLNLSKGGVMIESSRQEVLIKGAEIEIEVVTVDKDGSANRRRLRGKIAWKKGLRYGVQFVRKPAK